MPQDYQKGLKNDEFCGVYINRIVCRDMCGSGGVLGFWNNGRTR